MTLPKHRNPTNSDRTASAPYNFVPLPEKVIPAVQSADELPDHDCYKKDHYTGYFDVTLTTRSPLYVRCPLTLDAFLRQERSEDEKVRNTPDFFYTEDRNRPVIPGSSLRGMLRSLLEVVSYGKLERITSKKLFFRTVDDTAVGLYYRDRMVAKVEAGLLMRSGDSYAIRVCQMARVRRNQLTDRLYQGGGPNKTPVWQSPPNQNFQWQPVWVKLSENSNFVEDLASSSRPNYQEGRLVITGDAPRKKKEFVFLLPDENAETLNVPEAIIERFHDDDQITQWQTKAFPRKEPAENYRQRDGFLGTNPQSPGEPIFFLREQDELTFIGRAQMFRLPYQSTPHDLLPEKLRKASVLDYADSLFGYVGRDDKQKRQGDKSQAYASRVNIADAMLIGKNENLWLSEQPFTPKILASPKPTAFQHYLTQHNPDDRKKLNHYGSPDTETTLRGHKMYWHQDDRQRGDLEDQGVPNNSTQHTQFRPVRAGVQFQFRIFFENLSERELGALCWVLHPVGPEGEDYCHSLGMGKPLGMGAVKLDATLHLTNRAERYTSLFNGDTWALGLETPQRISDRNTLLQLTKPFEEHILAELVPEPACEHLYGLKRIAMLLKMLEWPGYPSDPKGNLHLGSRPNTRYMTIQPNEYRDRPVLPDPSAFGDLTGTSEPNLLKAQELEVQRRKEEAQRKEQEARERELAKLPPLLRELHRDGYDRSSFIGDSMRKWLERLEQATGDEQRDIAQYLKEWYLKHREDQWQKPNKRNTEKIAPIKRVLGEP